jgi:hypothetical protein
MQNAHTHRHTETDRQASYFTNYPRYDSYATARKGATASSCGCVSRLRVPRRSASHQFSRTAARTHYTPLAKIHSAIAHTRTWGGRRPEMKGIGNRPRLNYHTPHVHEQQKNHRTAANRLRPTLHMDGTRRNTRKACWQVPTPSIVSAHLRQSVQLCKGLQQVQGVPTGATGMRLSTRHLGCFSTEEHQVMHWLHTTARKH